MLGLENEEREPKFDHIAFKDHIYFNQDHHFYETRLPWKSGQIVLIENKQLANARLINNTKQ